MNTPDTMEGMIGMVERTRGLSKRIFIIATCVAIFVIGGIITWNVLHPNDPKAANEATAAKVINAVKNLYMVPDETPTVSLVQDRSKLDGQQFFDKAETGDYVLVYLKAKIALIYREKVNKLVTAGPINVSGDQPGQAAGASTQKP